MDEDDYGNILLHLPLGTDIEELDVNVPNGWEYEYLVYCSFCDARHRVGYYCGQCLYHIYYIVSNYNSTIDSYAYDYEYSLVILAILPSIIDYYYESEYTPYNYHESHNNYYGL